MIRIDAAGVNGAATVADLVAPMRAGFAGDAVAPPRGHHDVGTEHNPGSLLVMPSYRPGAVIGVKIATVFPGNAERGLASVDAAYVLASGETGRMLALIDGHALTLVRTAAVSALAADLLAPRTVKTLLMVGTGALAGRLIEGHMAVRAYERVEIWGRSPDKAERLAAEFRGRGIDARPATDLDAAVSRADVISCATLAEAPLVAGARLSPRVHLDLVGGFRPAMREADDDCFTTAMVVVDNVQALDEAGDLIHPISTGVLDRAAVIPLAQLCRASAPSPRPDRTVFKSVGSALADLAAAEWIFARVEKAAAG